MSSMRKGIVKLLEDQITESDSGSFDVGEQRERNHRYYTMQPLGNEQKGRSQYIDPSVLDAAESKKALFSETFLSNRQTVKFKAGNSSSPQEADAKTAYSMQCLRRNKHEELFRDGWHDAFIAKREVMLVYWKKDRRDVTLEIQGAQTEQVKQLIAQEGQVLDIDESQLQTQQMPGAQGPIQMHSGSLTITVDDSYVKMELVQPERYYRDPLSTYPADASWCSVEKDMSRGMLIKEDYDPDQIDSLSVDYRFRSDEEDSARKAHDMSWTRRRQYDRGDGQQHVTTYKTWTWINLADEDYGDLELGFELVDDIKLYEIHWAHGEILIFNSGKAAIMEAEEMPFFEWAELKVSHAEFGLCTADIMAHTQKVQSTLKRLIIDNQQMRNNTRYEAVMGALKNPRDLLDPRIGGVVWSRAVGSVAPLATPELSPLTMAVVQMLQQDGERRDGYSGLGKGVNNDAIRYQNADSMIERMTTAGTRRPMKAARDWAATFLIPVSQYIVQLAMRNDKTQQQLEVGGRMVPVVPSQWQDDDVAMDVAVALTPEEGKIYAQQLLTLHGVMQQDPELATVYRVEQKHALMDAVFDAMGVSDSTPFMQRPDSPEYKQSMQQNQQEKKQQEMKQEQLTYLKAQLEQSKDRRAWEQQEWDKTQDMDNANRDAQKLLQTTENDRAKMELGWAQLAQEAKNDAAEIKLEQTQRRPVSVGN